MPLPILFIGIGVAALTGVAGAGKTAGAIIDHTNAKKLNQNSQDRQTQAVYRLEALRKQCGVSFDHLGGEKLFVLSNSLKKFVDTFSQLKNVDFQSSVGVEELKKFHIDKVSFKELEKMSSLAASLTKGTAAGITGGAMTAFGAYSAASTFAAASTGTAISTLSGAASTNATLAFFGGGSLASGGLGIAGGTAVLGGLVAGPALLVMGTILGAKAGKNLENAKANAAKTNEYCEQLENGSLQCIAIGRRTNILYSALALADSKLYPLTIKLEEIIAKQGNDYTKFTQESKNIVAMAASSAVTAKAIINTPILTDDGSLTEQSEIIERNVLEHK